MKPVSCEVGEIICVYLWNIWHLLLMTTCPGLGQDWDIFFEYLGRGMARTPRLFYDTSLPGVGERDSLLQRRGSFWSSKHGGRSHPILFIPRVFL